MNIKELPVMLFDVLSKEFKFGDERKIGEYRVIEFKDRIGALGLCVEDDRSVLVLWPRLPNDSESSESNVFLRITAGPTSTGLWIYGHGDKIKYSAIVTFHSYGINLHSPVFVAAALVLQRAAKMVSEFEFERPSFGEADRHPELSYKSPD